MPKEKINYIQPMDMPEPGPDGVIVLERGEVDPQLCIHWGRSDVVQISLTLTVEDLREILSAWDQGIRFGDAMDDEIPLYSGSLNRGDLQRLIKFSRKARDVTYGADE